MRYMLLLIFIIISCKSAALKSTVLTDINENHQLQEKFTKIENNDGSLNLYFKIEKKLNSPVKIFTYYVENSRSKKIIKTPEQVAAEQIYWKDNTTLAIIPYVEVIPKNDVIVVPEKINEILIIIK